MTPRCGRLPPGVLLGAGENHDAPQSLLTRGLPLFGSVPAGHPAEVDPNGQLELFPVLAHMWGESRYVLRVHGESMFPKYQHGDLILVEYLPGPSPEAVRGKTCVCLHNRGQTIKVVDVQRGNNGRRIVLKGANVESPVIVVEEGDDFAIQGRVLGIVQRLD